MTKRELIARLADVPDDANVTIRIDAEISHIVRLETTHPPHVALVGAELAGARGEPPVCRFGPGGDFTRPWPRAKS